MNKEQLAHKIVGLRERVFALQKEIDEAEAEIAKMKEPEEWPKVGDKYYSIAFDGTVCYSIWNNYDCEADRVSIGNVFRTKEEAKFAVERLKVLAEMRKFASVGGCWVIDYEKGEIETDNFGDDCSFGTFAFEHEADALECINAIGEGRLKKYYFGVSN